MKLNKAGLAFKELRFSPSTKDEDITNAAKEIWKIENLAVDMYEMLDSLKEDYPLSHPVSMEIEQLLKRARGE